MNSLVGKTLKKGQYFVEKELGVGGCGITYKALDLIGKKEVAIKTFKTGIVKIEKSTQIREIEKSTQIREEFNLAIAAAEKLENAEEVLWYWLEEIGFRLGLRIDRLEWEKNGS